ncbi:MAG: hypothetical protein K2X93_23005 [Candidatus Obscuribacterales bacterium]|nr:hypothetical protein [Candidatus Obscuribacterales bacterium]
MSRERAIENLILRLTEEKGDLRLEIKRLEMKIVGLEKELESWRDSECEHRCGCCDNGKVCAVHDCENSPFFDEGNFCEDCGSCKTPHDDQPMGPCDPCKCKPVEEYDIKDVANKIHKLRCRANHTDQCSWDYESDWEQSEHKTQLRYARKFCEQQQLSAEQAFILLCNYEAIEMSMNRAMN